MTRRIVFVGVAGSGKSTLASDVFTTLKKTGVNAEAVHEWIRYEIQARGRMTSIWEQYRTRMHQQRLEDAVPSSVDVSIIDSGTLLPYFYSTLYADLTDARHRLVIQDMHHMLVDDLFLGRYDLIFYVPPQQGTNTTDGTRYQTDDELLALEEHMRLVFTKVFRVPAMHVIDGPFVGRLEKVMDVINASGFLPPEY